MPDAPTPLPSEKPRHFPPPPPLVAKAPGLWRRTPPAVFPPIMGLFGLGLSWRTLAAQPGLHPFAPIGEVILGATLLLFAFGLFAWLSKPLRRPSVVLDELRVLPGRAGLAAMVLSLALSGAALVPYAPNLALVLAGLAIAGLMAVGVLIGWAMATGPVEARIITPVFHLTFAGYIIAPLTLVPLGYSGTAMGILLVTTGAVLVIWLVSLVQLIKRAPPAPLRPLLAIHLAPASLFTIVSSLLELPQLAIAFGVLALLILSALLVSIRWVLAAGFSPLWGALTFPLAACAIASMMALGGVGLWIGAALLFTATALNPWVATRVIKAWATGKLGPSTNAATA